ncbi:MAG TPA: universal stress protein [Solirubrobacterales bacterium]|nr:universal stress protein [Solirubrobacterales bacterium]
MGEIIVGYDGSEVGRAALREASALAKELGDRVVIVFGYAPGGYGGGEIPTHREAVEELGEKITAEATELAESLGVEHTVELLPLRPDHALLKAAEERDARMIVVGSYGEPPLRGVILGSTPHKLLHTADRPVLVVPASN